MIGTPSLALQVHHAIRRLKKVQNKVDQHPRDSDAREDMEFWEAQTMRLIDREEEEETTSSSR